MQFSIILLVFFQITTKAISQSLYTAVNKKTRIECLNNIADAMIYKNKGTQLKNAIVNYSNIDTLYQNIDNYNIAILLNNYSFNNYLDSCKISFIHFFDWKDDARDFEKFAEVSIQNNFEEKFILKHQIDTKKWSAIDIAYPKIGKHLFNLGYGLANIDIDCDCYVPIIYKLEMEHLIKNEVSKMGYIFETFLMAW